jgi:hypothetical protein
MTDPSDDAPNAKKEPTEVQASAKARALAASMNPAMNRTLPMVLVVALALGLAFWLGKRQGQGPILPTRAASVPAPSTLLLEARLPSPDVSWRHVQNTVGGPLAILPSSVGGLLAVAFSVDVQLGDMVDGKSPMFGACVLHPEREQPLGCAATLALSDARKAASSPGAKAAFTLEKRGDWMRLIPKREVPAVFAVEDSTLVVADSEATLVELAPYLLRALPLADAKNVWSAPFSESDLAVAWSRSGVSSVTTFLRKRWEDAKVYLRAEEQKATASYGRRADVADPAALLGLGNRLVEHLLERGDELDGARLALTVPAPANPRFRLEFAAYRRKAAAGVKTGWISALPSAEKEAFLFPTGEHVDAAMIALTEPDEAGESGELLGRDLASVFGDRLPSEDGKRLSEATRALARAKGQKVHVALVNSAAGVVPLVCTESSAERVETANRAMLAFAETHFMGSLLDPKTVVNKAGTSVGTASVRSGAPFLAATVSTASVAAKPSTRPDALGKWLVPFEDDGKDGSKDASKDLLGYALLMRDARILLDLRDRNEVVPSATDKNMRVVLAWGSQHAVGCVGFGRSATGAVKSALVSTGAKGQTVREASRGGAAEALASLPKTMAAVGWFEPRALTQLWQKRADAVDSQGESGRLLWSFGRVDGEQEQASFVMLVPATSAKLLIRNAVGL